MISGWKAHINTRKLHWNVLRITDIFLNQKRAYLLLSSDWQKTLKREECDTYLIHIFRHRWSRENPAKRSNMELSANNAWLSSVVVYVYNWWKPQCWLKALYLIFSPGSLHSSNVYRHESDRCRTLPFFLTFFYHFNFLGFPFILMSLLIKKDFCDFQNISVNLLCVYVYLSSGNLFIFSVSVSSFLSHFCVIRTSVFSLSNIGKKHKNKDSYFQFSI